ncbi:MAG TPA: rhomboid family intramembrane serine protease, partial [Ferruginibacter sp.]|nr:rhomboid family intramembrane serine protease [Ferruginibacter sp.]
TTLAPNYRFFTQIRGGIPIWVLMLAYLIINFAGVAGMNAAYSLSHMGGALAGFLFVFFLKKGYDGSAWMNRFYHKMVNMFSPAATPDKKSIREKVFYQSGGRSPYKKSTIITQQRIDEILDKINQKGYHFLTEEEKQILKKAAEEDNL